MRILHTSITVKDMDTSIKFYRDIMGLQLQRRRKIPENKAEIAFFVDGESDAQIELTFWEEKEDWNEGDELDHLAFAVRDMDEAMKKFREEKVDIALEPYSLKGSTTRIAFIKDPNGIWLELIESVRAKR
ncbi:MAG: VOC family protein [Candidatus Hodarchaeales archaeon]